MEKFYFYQESHTIADPIEFSKDKRSEIFTNLVSDLKNSKGEKKSLDVAKKTWIKCITSPIKSSKTNYYLYNIEKKDAFDEDADVTPTLFASWFYYKRKDKKLNALSNNQLLLVGEEFFKNQIPKDVKKDYFSKTTNFGRNNYYVLKKLGALNRNDKFIVNLLWWIGSDVLKLDESFLLKKIYVYLSDSESISEENINLDDLKGKLRNYFPEEIKRLQSKPCSFDEVFYDIIVDRLSLPKDTYQFEADCHRYFMLEDKRVCYELSNPRIDNGGYHQKKVRAKLYAIDSENRYEDPEIFKNKCVKVTGTLGFNETTARFQLYVKTIEKKSDYTSLWKERMEWEEKCADILNKEILKLTKLPAIRPEKKIIVISQEDSKGYTDFKEKLSLEDAKSKDKLMIKLKSVGRFKAEQISAAIRETLEIENCQCICIVRGGGDQQQMHEFSKPDLLRAIHAAIGKGISVVVAIGHAIDKPLCYYVDGVYGADTPTDAGIAIKNRFQRYLEDKIHRKKRK